MRFENIAQICLLFKKLKIMLEQFKEHQLYLGGNNVFEHKKHPETTLDYHLLSKITEKLLIEMTVKDYGSIWQPIHLKALKHLT